MQLDDALLLIAEWYYIPMMGKGNMELLTEIGVIVGPTFWQQGVNLFWDWSGPFGEIPCEDYSTFVLLVREAIK